uniref:Uncharacterized protein n=1 Tax=Rubinisphaera brasiliensis (strain ATCC 49424 / DSM 5305 / JCM 21570 / IAM 15109 / NBRC 103401 / IFAM 1448) TaxID=756272 RepID=F0SPM8_RUBBR|nr:hypothetical protein Plabr_1375 [Rubinisphaera brasiliensis DSM 5305]
MPTFTAQFTFWGAACRSLQLSGTPQNGNLTPATLPRSHAVKLEAQALYRSPEVATPDPQQSADIRCACDRDEKRFAGR